MNVPASLVAGDTWSWTADYGDFPADSWTATAYFENSAESFEVVATADGTTHDFAEIAATTADYVAGNYYVQVRVTDGTDRFTIEQGWVEVKPDPAAGPKYDHRSWARQTLDAIEAFLIGNATTAQQSMSVGGRSISRWSLAELTQWRDQLRGEVRAAEQGSTAGLGRDIKVRYGCP